MMPYAKSHNVQIWVGLREGYTGTTHSINDVRELCDLFVSGGGCVSITATEFRYTNGFEDGVVVGFINYPRFVRRKRDMVARALALADVLRRGLGQIRVSVVTPRKTYMIGEK